jgi:hypothetical protein
LIFPAPHSALLKNTSIIIKARRNASAFLNFEVARSWEFDLNFQTSASHAAPAKLRRGCAFLCHFLLHRQKKVEKPGLNPVRITAAAEALAKAAFSFITIACILV